MFLINGLEQDTLPANDRAIQFGDGCFTTARILDGDVCLLEAHIRRLQHGCEKLMIPFTHWTRCDRKCASWQPERTAAYSKSSSAAAVVAGVTAPHRVSTLRVFSPFLLIPRITLAGEKTASR